MLSLSVIRATARVAVYRPSVSTSHLTLSERGRHCRTCTVRRRTRRWPAGRSWWRGGEAGAMPRPLPAHRALTLHCTARALTITPALRRAHTRPRPTACHRPIITRATRYAVADERLTVPLTIHFWAGGGAHARYSAEPSSRWRQCVPIRTPSQVRSLIRTWDRRCPMTRFRDVWNSGAKTRSRGTDKGRRETRRSRRRRRNLSPIARADDAILWALVPAGWYLGDLSWDLMFYVPLMGRPVLCGSSRPREAQIILGVQSTCWDIFNYTHNCSFTMIQKHDTGICKELLSDLINLLKHYSKVI